MMKSTTDTSEIDHIVASEQYRLQTFDSLTHFPSVTRRQLALAGFIYRQSECVCPQCGIKIDPETLDENYGYAANYFRQAHRRIVSELGKRCAFLLCEVGTNIDDLHPSLSSQQPPQWDDAEEPDYANYTKRLESFDKWPDLQQGYVAAAQHTYVTPQAMAKHGFFFSGPKDGVTCFYCGNTLMDWLPAIESTNENIVQLEHARFFPCRFVTYTAGGKFVANAGYFHSISPQERRDRNPMSSTPPTASNESDETPRTIDQCLQTFQNWPRHAPVSAQALAATGFYYLGEGLRVECYKCHLVVDDWRHGMTALGTHRKRGNGCEIVLAIDSTKTGDIQTVNEKWRLETLADLSFGDSDTKDRYTPETAQLLCRELAACGFYRSKNTNFIRCAYCGVTIVPKLGRSIMAQHRHIAKQSVKAATNQASTVDCLMVRAQCPANTVIPHRERFPEYPEYKSIFDRMKTFDVYQQKRKLTDSTIREMGNAGFFLDAQRRMRCFQCGNSLPVSDRVRQEKYPQYDMTQLHAHFYPTCEWVQELLGAKYIAQVLRDRHKSDESELQHRTSLDAQVSSASSQATTDSCASVMTTPAVVDVTSPSRLNRLDESLLSDQSNDSSDEDDFETVASPPSAYCIAAARSPAPSAPTNESSSSTATTERAQACSDPASATSLGNITSPSMTSQINPFKQLVLKDKHYSPEGVDGGTSPDIASYEMSPSIGASSLISSPVDIRSLLAHESNRLETFRKQHRSTFARIDVAHLAYVGFFLHVGGAHVECPWCEVELTEERLMHIMDTQPSVARSTLSDEPWTPMRVHRHANGLRMGQTHSWCTWVRREAGGLYPNIAMLESQLLYPEYPSYSSIEKRMKSFTSEWKYPSGSRLSNQMMAEAGFIYMGGDSVCCFYCGNKLQKFEPRDCPFEEHATFYPLCDFIQKVRGLDYVNRIILEYGRIPQGRLKYELDGTQKIKRIIFDKSGATKRKSERPPASRINSSSSRSPSSANNNNNNNGSRSTIDPIQTTDDACLICAENPATHEYDPCQHFPICGECFARLEQDQYQTCMLCFQPATIRMRVPNTPLIQ